MFYITLLFNVTLDSLPVVKDLNICTYMLCGEVCSHFADELSDHPYLKAYLLLNPLFSL